MGTESESLGISLRLRVGGMNYSKVESIAKLVQAVCWERMEVLIGLARCREIHFQCFKSGNSLKAFSLLVIIRNATF